MDIASRVASNVTRIMTQSGVTQAGLAEAANIPRSTLIRRLKGEAFKLNELDAIAAALNVSVADLIADDEVAA